MSYAQEILYERAHSLRINKENDSLFYYFDWDERSYDINMEFQHFHAFFEIYILLDTKASHIIEGKYFPLKMNDMVFLRPALLHKSEYPPGPPRKRIVIDFAIPNSNVPLESSLKRIFSIFYKDEPVFRFTVDVQKRIFALLNEIFTLSKSSDPIRDILIHTKFIEFLSLIYKERHHNLYKDDVRPDTQEYRVYTATSWIHEHYKTEITLEDLAEQCNMSAYYLSHLFRKVTGFTVVNYIQMTRIRNVQQLLLYTDKKINEIAEICGFTSFSQFNRTFHKFCNVSPSQFRTRGESSKSLKFFNE